jgi:murein DD-endopeptidase MepM/ murein hydrolase activator NlpD
MSMREKSLAVITLFFLVAVTGGEAVPSWKAGALYFHWPMGSPDPTGELALGHGLYVMQNYANPNPDFDNRKHAGVDLSWLNDLEAHKAAGMPVFAAADGRVKCIDDKITWPGRIVVLEHELPRSEVVYSVYGHLNDPWVVEGQTLASGEPIGSIFDQGSLSHLHYEIRDFPYWSDKKQFGGTDEPEYERAPTADNDVICAGRGYKPAGEDALPRLSDYGWQDPVRFNYRHRPPWPRPVVTTPQKSLDLYKQPRTNARVIGSIPRESTLTAHWATSRVTSTEYCRNLLARDVWYQVDHGSLRGYVPGFVCKGWRSEINVGELARLGPDWQPPTGRPLIEYLFDDPEAFARGVVTNSGSLGPRFDGTPIDANLSGSGGDYALDLDGDNAFLEVNNSRYLPRTALAVEARVWRAANKDEDAIVSKWFGQDQWLLTLYPDGNGMAIFSVRLEDGSYESIEYLIPDADYLGQWVHVAARYERGRMRLYWQGKLVGERFFSGRMARGLSLVHVGDAGGGTFWSRFQGLIDEVRIWRPQRRPCFDC